MRYLLIFSAGLFVMGCNTTDPSPVILPGATFVTVGPGQFDMGAPEGEEGSMAIERPVHTVSIDYSFEIMTTEVTQGMWQSITGENPSTGDAQGDDIPVYNVTWDDCIEFCEILSSLDENYHYRLPSEAEWEYSCRAGTSSPYYWGNEFLFFQYCAWCNGSAGGSLQAIRLLQPNSLGLYDIAGNVYEWCQDTYHGSYEGAPDDGSAWSGEESDRIIRGGCWNTSPLSCRSAFREPAIYSTASEQIGFRIVRVEK